MMKIKKRTISKKSAVDSTQNQPGARSKMCQRRSALRAIFSIDSILVGVRAM